MFHLHLWRSSPAPLQWCWTFWKFLPSGSHILDLWSSAGVISGFLVSSLFSLDQFGQTTIPRRVLVCSKHPPFQTDEDPSALGDHQCSKNVSEVFSSSVPPHTPVSELWSQFFWPHGFYSDIINYFGLKISCRKISEMIKRNGRMFKGQNKWGSLMSSVDKSPRCRTSRRKPSEDLLVCRQEICYTTVGLQHNLSRSQMLQLMLTSVEGGLVWCYLMF